MEEQCPVGVKSRKLLEVTKVGGVLMGFKVKPNSNPSKYALLLGVLNHRGKKKKKRLQSGVKKNAVGGPLETSAMKSQTRARGKKKKLCF